MLYHVFCRRILGQDVQVWHLCLLQVRSCQPCGNSSADVTRSCPYLQASSVSGLKQQPGGS